MLRWCPYEEMETKHDYWRGSELWHLRSETAKGLAREPRGAFDNARRTDTEYGVLNNNTYSIELLSFPNGELRASSIPSIINQLSRDHTV